MRKKYYQLIDKNVLNKLFEKDKLKKLKKGE